MSIMLEAQIAHDIERAEKIKKYKTRSESDMNRKINKFLWLQRDYEREKELSNDDIDFLINEIKLLYDKEMITKKPYLEKHLDRLILENNFIFIFENLKDFITDSTELVENIQNTIPIKFFNKKKFNNIKNKANEILNEFQNEVDLMKRFLGNNQSKFPTYKQVEDNYKDLVQKYENNLLEKNDIYKLIDFVDKSILEQVISTKLFFKHHFTNVNRTQRIIKDTRTLQTIFQNHIKLLKKVSNSQPKAFEWEDYLNEIRRNANLLLFDDSLNYRIFRRIKNEIERNEESIRRKESNTVDAENIQNHMNLFKI